MKIAASLGAKTGDKVNFFEFQNREYVGLESRRLHYEEDKLNGTNHVEKLIAAGVYKKMDKASSKTAASASNASTTRRTAGFKQ